MSIITVSNLSKKYIIGHDRNAGAAARCRTLRDSLTHLGRSAFQRLLHPLSPNRENTDLEEFWALRDVSFEINQGDRVGIIGRNGAGKSTLLKILSRITEPTTGKIQIKGRVASLLEVGTGFHPELSGRENIYLNGAVLGMTRAEIKRKFDEIVAFAEVEKFLDTPVKHYSSGMYVRLAFAVAAHLEPEILVVDEVLAVGDAQFQRKCLGKMEDVAKEGRTVLFVSHNMGMISSLCSKAILLERGNLILNGAVADGVSRYYNSGLSSPFSIDFIKNNRTIGDSFACLLEAHIEDTNGKHVGEIDIRSSFKVVMKYFIKEKVPFAPAPNLHFYNAQGGCAFATSNMEISFTNIGEYISVCKIPGNLLNNDTYFIDLGLTFTRPTTHTSFYERGALSFNIIDPIEETLEEMRFGFAGIIPGVVRPKLEWEIMKI